MFGVRIQPSPVANRDATSPTTILHVCEAFDGGVATAVHSIVRKSPELAHVILLVSPRPRLGVTEREPGVVYLGDDRRVRSRLSAMWLVLTAYRRIRPARVHAHSSFAGVYVRCIPVIPAERIVYSPHCFAFERTDVNGAFRSLFRLVERLLAFRIGTFAACSEREAALALELRPDLRVVDLAKTPDIPPQLRLSAKPPGEQTVTVVGVGRLSAQKDPEFFAKVAELGQAKGSNASWVWVGDGKDTYRTKLHDAGVVVTGWQRRDQVLEHLRSGHVLLHTAAWEAFPLVVLEAAAIGLPVIVRDVPAMAGTPAGTWVTEPDQAARSIVLMTDPAQWQRAADITQERFLEAMRNQETSLSVSEIYQLQKTRVARDGAPSRSVSA